jgi:hypothetical protein
MRALPEDVNSFAAWFEAHSSLSSGRLLPAETASAGSISRMLYRQSSISAHHQSVFIM